MPVPEAARPGAAPPSPGSAARPRGQLALLALLLAQIAFGLLAMTICLPSMPEWGTLFAADPARVQLSFSAYVLAYGVCQLVYGPLSDRHGRKQVLLAGMALAAAGSLAAAAAPTLEWLSLARAVQGSGTAAGMVIGRAMVQDLFQGPQRTRVMAYVGMVMGLCPPLAILVGGQLHVLLGWRANFVLIALAALLLMVAAWRRLPASRPVEHPDAHWLQHMLQAYARLSREGRFLRYVAIIAMTSATFYVFLAGAPLVLRGYGIGPQSIGWYIMAVPLSYIVGNYLTSHLIHRVGEARLMALGQVANLAGLGLLLALGLAGLHHPLAFSLPLVLLGIGHGLLMPACLAGTVGVVPVLAGSAAAVAGLMQQLMGAVGGFTVGLVPHEGPVPLAGLMLGFTLCGLAAQLAGGRRR